jgi:hypothetical protein
MVPENLESTGDLGSIRGLVGIDLGPTNGGNSSVSPSTRSEGNVESLPFHPFDDDIRRNFPQSENGYESNQTPGRNSLYEAIDSEPEVEEPIPRLSKNRGTLSNTKNPESRRR